MAIARFLLIACGTLIFSALALSPRLQFQHDAPVAPQLAASQPRGPYTYHGCRVYSSDDWFTTNLVAGGSSYATNTVDPRSANIIANLSATFPGLYLNEANPGHETTVNLATNATPTHAVSGTRMLSSARSSQGNTIPVTTPFYEEGSAYGGCRGDCHAIVLNTDTCVDYETYLFGSRQWDGASYNTGYGSIYDLKKSLNSQYAEHVGITAAGLPLLGMTDFGEDASAASIDHIVDFSLPGSGAAPNASGGYVAPAAVGHTCKTNCANKLPLGARLRLRSSYSCPSRDDYPQAHLVCVQLKTYGMLFADWNGSYGPGTSIIQLRFGTTTTGANPWDGRGDLYPGLKDIKIGDFDVMTLGEIR